MDPAAFAETLWRPMLVCVVLGIGVLVTLATVFVQLRGLPKALRAVAAPHDGGRWRVLLAGSAGMGAISGSVVAITLGGPGALVWMWITTFFGMALHWSEVTLAESDDDTPHAQLYMTRHLGSLGRPLAAVFAVGLIASAIAAGGLFQTHQGGVMLHAALDISAVAAAVIIATCAIPFVIVASLRGILVKVLVPGALVLYLATAATIIFADPLAAGLVLGDAINAAFGLAPAGGGAVGGAVAVALHHGVLRATFAGETGVGTAALAGLRGSSRAVAMLVPLFTTGLLATSTVLVVTMAAEEDESVVEPRLVPLERHESRGLRPSQQVGQTIVLPLDTALEDGKAYGMKLRANPRGHALGTLRLEHNLVFLPSWQIAKNVDTVVFRSRDPERAKHAAWDVRVKMTREFVELGEGRGLLKLQPADPELELRKFLRQHELDTTPYLVLDDYTFVGRVGTATSPDPELGEHLAMYEPAPEDAPFNPKIHELFRAGYRGPYADVAEERPPWAFVAREGFTPAIGKVLELRFRPDPRGEAIVRLNRAGMAQAPPWDFLADVDTLIVRHDTDPSRDIHVPVRVEFDEYRARFWPLDEAWEDFRRIEKMEGHSGPYARISDLSFEVEVRSDARLPSAFAGRRSLVPLHPQSEPTEPSDALPYRPHPGELMALGMHGPYMARDGAAIVVARFGSGSWRMPIVVLAGFILALSSIVVWAQWGARGVAHLLGASMRTPARLAFVLAASCGGLFTLGQVLGLADAAIAIAVIPNLVALTLSLPRVCSALRKPRDSTPSESKKSP